MKWWFLISREKYYLNSKSLVFVQACYRYTIQAHISVQTKIARFFLFESPTCLILISFVQKPSLVNTLVRYIYYLYIIYSNLQWFITPGYSHYLWFVNVDFHAILPSSVNQSVHHNIHRCIWKLSHLSKINP